MHVTSYATHTRRRKAGQTIRQWHVYVLNCSIHIKTFTIRVQCIVSHQTPAQLYQPAWDDHHLIPHGRNLNNPQMLWHVPGLWQSQRQWGCVPTVAVCTYLQEEWAVEREDDWLVDAGSVSILLYNCADPEPDMKCRTHTCEFIFNSSKTLPLSLVLRTARRAKVRGNLPHAFC